MHLLQSARTMCRVLDKLGESDSDNVHRRTGVGDMVSTSGAEGRFHVKPEENQLRPALVHRLPIEVTPMRTWLTARER